MSPRTLPLASDATGSPPELLARTNSACSRAQLATLREAVSHAQEAVLAMRRSPADREQLATARREHLAAMLAYERALTSLRLPVPPRLRDELRLLRRVVPDGARMTG